MIAKKNLLLSIALLVSFILAACGNDSSNSAALATDYSKAAHWLSLPAVVEKVDIFYLYPTAWTSTDPDNPHVCAIDEPTMLTQAPEAFARQATAFETVGNIYAPFYRQDNGSSIDRLNVIAGIPTLDAVAAFDYYIKHFNNNRPYILVGHSQGATVLSNLLSEYMKDHPDVYSRMIAAYVIGNPITDAYLAANPHLKFAEGPDDTGVIISYNTQADYFFTQDPPVPPNPVLYGMVGRVINPINWKTDETYAAKTESLGSFMPNHSLILQTMPHYADARIDIDHGVSGLQYC
jgi:pimeloyl-ACP methyl ester carboxylesterase